MEADRKAVPSIVFQRLRKKAVNVEVFVKLSKIQSVTKSSKIFFY